MQQVTSTSHQVALNTQGTKNRFGFETNWSQVTNPSGRNIITRTVSAVLAVFVNLAKSLVNAFLKPLNLVHGLIFGYAPKSIAIEDEIEIQQDSVTIDVSEPNPIEEEMPEPVIVESNKNWQNAGLAAAGVVGLVAATALLARGAEYIKPGTVPGAAAVDNFIFGTIPNGISSGASAGATAVRNGFCWATFGKICTPSYAGNP